MICPNCRREVVGSSGFCELCGTAVAAMPAAGQPQGYSGAPTVGQPPSYGGAPVAGQPLSHAGAPVAGAGVRPQAGYGMPPQAMSTGAPQAPGYGGQPQAAGYGGQPQAAGYGGQPQAVPTPQPQPGYGGQPQAVPTPQPQPGYGGQPVPQQPVPQQPAAYPAAQPQQYGAVPRQQQYGAAQQQGFPQRQQQSGFPQQPAGGYSAQPYGGMPAAPYGAAAYGAAAMPQPKKSKTGLLVGIIIAAVVVLAAGSIGGYFIFQNLTAEAPDPRPAPDPISQPALKPDPPPAPTPDPTPEPDPKPDPEPDTSGYQNPFVLVDRPEIKVTVNVGSGIYDSTSKLYSIECVVENNTNRQLLIGIAGATGEGIVYEEGVAAVLAPSDNGNLTALFIRPGKQKASINFKSELVTGEIKDFKGQLVLADPLDDSYLSTFYVSAPKL